VKISLFFSIFELATCVTYKIFSSGIFGGVDLGAFSWKIKYKKGEKGQVSWKSALWTVGQEAKLSNNFPPKMRPKTG
jgi:hypothetical protein